MTEQKKPRRKYRMAYVPKGPDNEVRRVRVVLVDGIKGFVVRYSDSCSGCTEGYEESGGSTPERGMGCHECGYTGRRRSSAFIPLNDKEMRKQDAQYEAREKAERAQAAANRPAQRVADRVVAIDGSGYHADVMKHEGGIAPRQRSAIRFTQAEARELRDELRSKGWPARVVRLIPRRSAENKR